MTEAALTFIDTVLSDEVDYQFMEFTTSPVPYPYFVGEYLETPSGTLEEDGYQETAFTVTGTGKTWLGLEQAKAAIKGLFPLTAILPNGNGITVFYDSSIPVPTGDAELKRIQINLTIKEWMVN